MIREPPVRNQCRKVTDTYKCMADTTVGGNENGTDCVCVCMTLGFFDGGGCAVRTVTEINIAAVRGVSRNVPRVHVARV